MVINKLLIKLSSKPRKKLKKYLKIKKVKLENVATDKMQCNIVVLLFISEENFLIWCLSKHLIFNKLELYSTPMENGTRKSWQFNYIITIAQGCTQVPTSYSKCCRPQYLLPMHKPINYIYFLLGKTIYYKLQLSSRIILYSLKSCVEYKIIGIHF